MLDLAGNPFTDTSTHTGTAYLIDQDTAEQAALSLHVTNTQVNSAGSAVFSFTVAGMESDDTGTVTFTDGVNMVSVNVAGGQTAYTANLGTLSDGPITSSLALNNDAAGNTFAPVAGTSAVVLSGVNVVNGVNSNNGTLQVVQNGSGDITVNPTGAVVGTAGDGVIAEQSATGTGNINVTSTGNVSGTGAGAIGLFAENLDAANNGNVTVTATGGVSGTQHGIEALTVGNGNVSVEAAGAITSTAQFGIRAENDGTGSVSVVTDPSTSINSGGTGISAINKNTNIPTTAHATVTVTAQGTITSGATLNPSGSAPKGIDAGFYAGNGTAHSTVNGEVVVNSDAQITAAGYGISAYNYGNGDVTVSETGGSINAAGAFGISAMATSTSRRRRA